MSHGLEEVFAQVDQFHQSLRYRMFFRHWYALKRGLGLTRLAVVRSWQRSRYGVSDEDTWGFDYHIAQVISTGVHKIRTESHGRPGHYTAEEWDKVLRNIEEPLSRYVESSEMIEDYSSYEDDARAALRLYADHFEWIYD